MSRRKSLAHYPSDYFTSCSDAALKGFGGRVPCDSMREALSLRGHFYAFIGSLRWEADRIKVAGKVLSAYEQEVIDLAALSSRVLVQIEKSPDGAISVAWLNRDASWQARKMKQRTFDNPPPIDVIAPDEAFLQELEKLQGPRESWTKSEGEK